MKAFIVLFALVAAAYADAEAEADPYLLYGGYNGYHGGLGWGGYHGAYAGLPYGAYGYAHSAYPYALSSAVKSVEVQPGTVEVKSTPIVHAAPALVHAAPLLHAAPAVVAAAPAVAPYVAGAPCVNHLGVPVPCALGHPLVNTHAIAKRDAEAEADPAYFYNGYHGYAGLGHFGYGYGGYGYAHAYGAYPYGVHAGYGLAPSDPTHPHLVHTSRLGVCVNYLGAQVPC